MIEVKKLNEGCDNCNSCGKWLNPTDEFLEKLPKDSNIYEYTLETPRGHGLRFRLCKECAMILRVSLYEQLKEDKCKRN